MLSLAQGADINWSNPTENNSTPLHKSVLSGTLLMAVWLVQSGCSLESMNGSDQTALDLCRLKEGKKEIQIEKWLVKKGGAANLTANGGVAQNNSNSNTNSNSNSNGNIPPSSGGNSFLADNSSSSSSYPTAGNRKSNVPIRQSLVNIYNRSFSLIIFHINVDSSPHR